MKVFIKTKGKIDTIDREKAAIKYAIEKKPSLKQYLPSIINISTHDDFIIEEYIEGESLGKYVFLSSQDKEVIISQIYSLYIELKEIKLKHLDIRPDNFVIKNDGGHIKCVLIDFGYGLINDNRIFYGAKQSKKTLKEIRNLNSLNRLYNDSWDEAYSFLMTMKFIEPSFIKTNYNMWKIINDDIGCDVVSI